MSKLLYIEGSPRKERSTSIAVAEEFINSYLAEHPDDQLDRVDLWDFHLPRFDGHVLNAKYAILHGQDHSPAEAEAWQNVVEVFDRFNSADRFLFSLPMWNFGVPYKFKHLVDVLTQPGLAFSFSPEEGYTGLVTGRPAAVVYARGGEYPVGTPSEAFDLQKRYVEIWLGFIGFTEIHSIVVEPTLDPARRTQVTQAAKDQARELGKRFGAKAPVA